MKNIWKQTGLIIFWAGWPVWRYLLGRSSRSRVIIFHDGAILAVKSWLGDDRWGLPGGGIRRGEQPAAAAVRELKEELGIIVSVDQLRTLWYGTHHDNGLRYEQYLYGLTVPDSTFRLDNKELTAARWMTRSQLTHERLKPELRRALELTDTNLV